jgi:hypothetical protein
MSQKFTLSSQVLMGLGMCRGRPVEDMSMFFWLMVNSLVGSSVCNCRKLGRVRTVCW